MGIAVHAAPAPDASVPPDFGPDVIVIGPSTHDAQHRIDAVHATQEAGQFDGRRYAILIQPGYCDLHIRVGFYTQVLGLGASPDDVDITGAVRCKADWMKGNATCNFWRAAENLSVRPMLDKGVDVWAVSQATAFRRVHVRGDTNLWDGGWSSGGFFADYRFDGTVTSGSQQQWISRNCDWGRWQGGAYNMVFVGVPDAPQGEWPDKPLTTVAAAPVVREKPYLTLDANGQYAVVVPGLRHDAAGLNAALDAGRHLLLTPGTYELAEPLRVTRPGTVVLGLGYATLRPTRGTAAVTVADVDGVTVAGLLLDAGTADSPELLRVGDEGGHASHAADPTALFDVFARAGGAAAGRCRAFITAHSNDVIADNLWLWRADHGRGVGWDTNPVANGLVVHGNNVTVYGLFVEHTQQYQTLWTGNGGRVYFYQSEFPYDPPTQAAWGNGGRGWATYKVVDSVTSHAAFGLGMYSVFKSSAVVVQNAVETPTAPGVQMQHLVTARFWGKEGGGIAHVINGQGDAVFAHTPARVK